MVAVIQTEKMINSQPNKR